MPPLSLTFLSSSSEVHQLPPSTFEVAVIGRSNVGKSSLINAIAGQRALARTSNTPGRTQLLNVFEVDTGGTVVDLPGYGYAKVSKTERDAWDERMKDYLLEREELVMVLALVDGEVGPTKLDQQVHDWMRSAEVPYTVVATKHDKVKSSARERRKRDLAEKAGVAKGDVVWVSAQKGVNIDRLRDLVRGWLSGADLEGDEA